MKRLASIWLLNLLALCAAAEKPLPQEGVRILCAVDTSFSMRGRRAATTKIISDLVSNGFEGNLHAGEKFGIWTFNEDVDYQYYPPVPWTPELAPKLAKASKQFLDERSLQKRTLFEVLLPQVEQFAENVDFLLVLIFTDGEDKIVGTPFDEKLNQQARALIPEEHSTKTPLAIVLTLRQGQYTSGQVERGSRRLEFPQLAPRTATLASEALAQERKVPPPSEKPLEAQPAKPTEAIKSAESKAPENKPEEIKPQEIVATKPAEPATQPQPAPKQDIAPPIIKQPEPKSSLDESKPSPVVQKPAESIATESARPVEQPPISNPAEPPPIQTLAAVIAETKPPVVPEVKPSSPPPWKSEPKPIVKPAEIPPPTPPIQETRKQEPPPQPKVARKTNAPATLPSAKPAKPVVPPVQAVATPHTFTIERVLLIVAFLIGVALLAYLFTTRKRHPSASLISKSIDSETRE
jgi:hypothetical protein